MTNQASPIFQNERVLVVDDITKWIETTKGNLTYYGCTLENITTAGNTREALERYENTTLIITDINFDINNLEDTQGLDLIKELRHNEYSNPIIAMSSLTGNIKERTIDVGANYFLDKRNFIKDFDKFAKWYTRR